MSSRREFLAAVLLLAGVGRAAAALRAASGYCLASDRKYWLGLACLLLLASPVMALPPALGIAPDGSKVEWGRALFFETALSQNGAIACATCHDPREGFAQHTKVSTGISGQDGDRNAPTLLGVTDVAQHFWDGRASFAEDQQLRGLGNPGDSALVQLRGPITNPVEMGQQTVADAVARIASIPGHQRLCLLAYRQPVNELSMLHALWSFESTLKLTDLPIQRRLKGEIAFSAAAERGLALIRKDGCFRCHKPESNFASAEFVNNGMGYYFGSADLGRYGVLTPNQRGMIDQVTGRQFSMARAFRVPTWFGIVGEFNSAPFGHHGDAPTLHHVLMGYNRGWVHPVTKRADPYIDPRIKPLNHNRSQIREMEMAISEGWTPPEGTYPLAEERRVK